MALDGIAVAKGFNVKNMKYHNSSGLGGLAKAALFTKTINRPFIPSNIHQMMKDNSPDSTVTYR